MFVNTPVFNIAGEPDWKVVIDFRSDARKMSLRLLRLHDPVQGKFPEHSILFLVKNILSIQHAPAAHVLPSPGRQLVEERNRMRGLDSVE